MKNEMSLTAGKFTSFTGTAMRLTLVATLLVVTIVVMSGCGIGKRILSGDEVQTLFAGKTVKGYHEKNEYSFISYYEPTGTFRSYQGGAKEPRLGKWWVNDRGDICIHWQEESQDLCRKMTTDDKGHYWKVLIKADGKRILIVTFESFVAGNVNDL